MADYVIEMLNITKEFPGIKANDDVTLQLKRGEIHALLGENGAGKSTLMSVLFGMYQQEQGIIKKDGKEVKINNPNDATALRIGMVHQHFKLVDVFTAAENIVLGLENDGRLDLKKAAKAAGDKSVAMVQVKELLGLTGYIRGGCSPVGMKKKYPTHFDETCILWDEIAVSAGERGHQMILPPEALAELINAKIVDLT